MGAACATAAEPTSYLPGLNHSPPPSPLHCIHPTTPAGVATTGSGNQVWQQSAGKTQGRTRVVSALRSETRVALCRDTEGLNPKTVCGSWSLLLPSLLGDPLSSSPGRLGAKGRALDLEAKHRVSLPGSLVLGARMLPSQELRVCFCKMGLPSPSPKSSGKLQADGVQ